MSCQAVISISAPISLLPMAAIVHGHIAGALAAAEIDGAVLVGLVFHGGEGALGLVGAIAERLAGTLATGAPPVGLALLYLYGKRGVAGAGWLLGHDKYLLVRGGAAGMAGIRGLP